MNVIVKTSDEWIVDEEYHAGLFGGRLKKIGPVILHMLIVHRGYRTFVAGPIGKYYLQLRVQGSRPVYP